MKFEFTSPAKIIFGAGALREAGAIARAFGKRALVVTGRDTKRAGPLLKILREAGVSAATFSVAVEPVCFPRLNKARHWPKRKNCELVVGFGGGSALDAAKAIAAMLANGGELLDYVESSGAAGR